MKTAIKLIWATLALGALLTVPALATNVPATLTINAVRDLSVSPSSLDFGDATLGDFEAGYTGVETMQCTIKSNTTWALTIYGSAATWGSNGGWQSKPRSDIKVKAVSTGGDADYSDFAVLPATADTIYTGGATTTSGVTKNIEVKVALSFANDSPGDYTYSNIVVTLGAQ